MKFALTIVVSVVMWVLALVSLAVMWVIGWPICAALVYSGRMVNRKLPAFGRTLLAWGPKWAYPWGNDEDGIDGLRGGSPDNYWWRDKTEDVSLEWRILWWSCWRNPVNNLRFVRPFGFVIDPDMIEFRGNSVDPRASYALERRNWWAFTWHGIYAGLWVIYRGYKFRIGWNILPKDRDGMSEDDYRSKGAGFKLQFGKQK